MLQPLFGEYTILHVRIPICRQLFDERGEGKFSHSVADFARKNFSNKKPSKLNWKSLPREFINGESAE